MEWIEGVKLTDRVRMAEAGLSVVDFVDVGIECTLRQLLDKGYFHAGAFQLLDICILIGGPKREIILYKSYIQVQKHDHI